MREISQRAKGVLPVVPCTEVTHSSVGSSVFGEPWEAVGAFFHHSLENGITLQPALGRYRCHCLACTRSQISGKLRFQENSFLSYLGSLRANELQFQQPLGPGLTLGKQLCYKYLPDEVNHQYP